MDSINTVSGRSDAASLLPGASKGDLAEIAHLSVREIEFLEMNDGNRLAYHIYLFLSGQLVTLREAIYEAKARTALPPKALEYIIRERLTAAGVSL